MAEDTRKEMISAFTVGCMDKENYDYFMEYLQKEGKNITTELGELQNIISLLPTVLEEEKPDPELKKRVAKKLLSLKDEIKSKIELEKQKNSTTLNKVKEIKEIEVDEKSDKEIHSEKEPVENINKKPEEVLERVVEPPPLPEDLMSEKIIKRKHRLQEEAMDVEDSFDGKKLWLSFLIISSLFIFIFFLMYYLFDHTDEKLSKLETEITQLKNITEENSNFRINYIDILEFFYSRDILTYTFSNSNEFPDVVFRLFHSIENKKTLIITKNLPNPESGKSYYIWIDNNQNYVPLESFVPLVGKPMWIIENSNSINPQITNKILITEELSPNSITPQGKTVSTGLLISSSK